MTAKHSAFLLSGFLVVVAGVAWAQTSTEVPRPSCAATDDEMNDNQHLYSKWLRAEWNAGRWEIDCSSTSSNALSNASYNMTNSVPSRTPGRSRFNSNYVNTNSNYRSNVNMNSNAVNAMPAQRARTKRRPGS